MAIVLAFEDEMRSVMFTQTSIDMIFMSVCGAREIKSAIYGTEIMKLLFLFWVTVTY